MADRNVPIKTCYLHTAKKREVITDKPFGENGLAFTSDKFVKEKSIIELQPFLEIFIFFFSYLDKGFNDLLMNFV